MAEVYSSLFKGNVHITTPFSSSHKGIDLGNYKVKNPIYSPNKLGSGTVSDIATSYSSQGKEWKNSLVVWITYDSGYVMSLYHGEVKDKIVNVGDRVVVGQQIYRTGNTGHSTGDHLHCAISRNGAFIDPAPLVINDLNVSVFKIGDEIEVTGTQNIRKGNGTSYPVTRVTQVGERYVIEGGPRIADGYTWWDLKGADWIAEVGKFKLYTPPTPQPQPAEPSECEKQLETLKQENRGLAEALATSQSTLEGKVVELTTANERVRFLEDTLLQREKELGGLQSDYDRILEERERFEFEKLELQKEIDFLKQQNGGWVFRIAEIIDKLFSKK
jgi:hypothetical protein